MIENRQKSTIILSSQSGNKSTCMTNCLPRRLIDLIGGPVVWQLSEMFDKEEPNQATTAFVQHYRWPDVQQRDRWGMMKANYNHLSYHITITSISHLFEPHVAVWPGTRRFSKEQLIKIHVWVEDHISIHRYLFVKCGSNTHTLRLNRQWNIQYQVTDSN